MSPPESGGASAGSPGLQVFFTDSRSKNGELPLAAPRFWGSMPSPGAAGQVAAEGEAKEVKLSGGTHVFRGGDEAQDVF